MVAQMVYLFIGEDSPAKDIKLAAIRQGNLSKDTEEFNLDRLYAEGLTLKDLQEKLFYLPVKCPKRIIAIKHAQNLKSEIKEFILRFVKKPPQQIILILDISEQAKAAEFIEHLYRYAKVFHFKETQALNAFHLNREISLKRLNFALRVLNQLLKDGERPERILGGLRYSWEKDTAPPLEMKRRLGLLLNCDIDIKTGRLKPNLALEKLVINLCGLGKSSH